MTNNTTYEDLLNTCSSYEAYQLFATKKIDDNFWLAVKNKNLISVYRHYISTLPKGIHVNEALSLIRVLESQQSEKAKEDAAEAKRRAEIADQLMKDQKIAEDKKAYEMATQKHTKESYEYYLKHHPNGLYHHEASLNIEKIMKQLLDDEDNAEFNTVLSAYDIESFQNYIKKYPDGIHVKEAKERINQIVEDNTLFNKALSINNIESFQNYIKKYPDGIHVKEAKERINQIIKYNKKCFDEKLEKDKKNIPFLIGGILINIIAIMFLSAYPDGTFVILALFATSIAALIVYNGHDADADADADAAAVALISGAINTLLLIYFYDLLHIIYNIIFGATLIGLISYTLYISWNIYVAEKSKKTLSDNNK